MDLMKISVIDDLYVDAVLTDESSHLLFLSLWGRDTALQEFMARVQLPVSDNGIRDFHVTGTGFDQYVQIQSVDALEKTSAKTSRDTVFGQLTQLWIYHQRVSSPDRVNRRAVMLYRPDEQIDPWPIVKSVCHLPLLDHWRDTIINCCYSRDWLRCLDNGLGVKGALIDLSSDDVEIVITEMIHNYELTLESGQLVNLP